MTLVFGAGIEPGGLELEDTATRATCAHCQSPDATRRDWQAVEGGSLNTYYEVSCDTCGHTETNNFF